MTPNQKWRKKNPLATTAHIRVAHAIQYGQLVPGPCEVCGTLEKPHAHHDDYHQPLVVRWLCALHHRQHHAKEAGQKIHPVPQLRKMPREGCKQFQPAPKRDLFSEQAKVLRASGHSYRAIAKTLNISAGTVFKWLNTVPYG